MQKQLHCITQHYTVITLPCANYITIHYNCSCSCKLQFQLPLHFATLRYLHHTTLHYSYNYTTLHYTTLDYTTLYRYHTRVHNATVHYYTRHYTTLHSLPQLPRQLQLHYTNYTTYYNSTTLHYNHSYNCVTPHYIQQLRWGDRCNHCHHSKSHNSNNLSVDQWIRFAIRDSQQPTSPSPSVRVQSQTEGEPTAQPPETVCQPASSVASRVMSLHQAAGKFWTFSNNTMLIKRFKVERHGVH